MKAAFEQESRLGKKRIVLSDDEVAISAGTGGRKVESTFRLSELAPAYERVRFRHLGLVMIPLWIAVLVALLARLVLSLTSFHPAWVLLPSAMVVLMSLWQSARGLAPVEVVRFRNKAGSPLFDIVKEKGQATEFELFVGQIMDQRRQVAGS